MLLQSRRLLQEAACNYPQDIFELAKEEYLQKLQIYCDDHQDQEQFNRFLIQEQARTEQLAQFNSTGSGDVYSGNNKKVRTGSPS